MTCLEESSWDRTKREAKPPVGAGLGLRVFRAIGGALVTRAAAKTAAAIHAIRACRRAGRVGHAAAGIRPIPIAAPLPDIAQHVMQTPSIGLFSRDWVRAAGAAGNIKTLAGVAVGAIPVVPGDFFQHGRVAVLHN